MKRPRPEPRRLRRGAYLLPSLLTMGNMILGSYAVVRCLRGDFQAAGVLILVAALLDGLDGYLARLTHTESEFGRQYDSLADVITFGGAPALLTFVWCQPHFGRLAWLLPVFYLVCTATRLARFNVQARTVDSRYFVGLPAPAAAGAIATLAIYAGAEDRVWIEGGLLAANVLLGALMISTFRYPSLKNADLRRRWSYRLALPLLAFVLLVIYRPPTYLLALAIFYSVSGPCGWLLGRLWRSRSQESIEPSADSRETRA